MCNDTGHEKASYVKEAQVQGSYIDSYIHYKQSMFLSFISLWKEKSQCGASMFCKPLHHLLISFFLSFFKQVQSLQQQE